MTYCVGLRLHRGLVFLADSRTNAGVDHISTFRKLTVFERAGERVMVLMSAGNLALSQAVANVLSEDFAKRAETSIWQAPNMFEAARRVGEAVRLVHDRDAEPLATHGVDFNVSLIFGGQIGNERCRLFQVYSAGNFIEALDEQTYFQIGESKYGKPILDRVIRPDTELDEAAKCALISMDSTLRSNISVGLPLDLLVYEADSLRVTRFASINENNLYFRMIRNTWGERLRQVFAEIADPEWVSSASPDSLVPQGLIHEPVRARPLTGDDVEMVARQTLAEGPGGTPK